MEKKGLSGLVRGIFGAALFCYAVVVFSIMPSRRDTAAAGEPVLHEEDSDTVTTKFYLGYPGLCYLERGESWISYKPRLQNTEYEPSDYALSYAICSEDIFCVYGRVSALRSAEERFGYVDSKGNLLTDIEYDFAYPFSEGFGCAMTEGKYGFLDCKGEMAIPFQYLDAAPFSEGLAYFCTEENYGFMDEEGRTVFLLDCDSVSSFWESLAYFSLDGKYGFINREGAVVVEPVYDDVSYFHDGIAPVRSGNFVGVIDVKGREVVPAVYDYITHGVGILKCRREDGEYDYYTFAGEKSTEKEYERAIEEKGAKWRTKYRRSDEYEVIRYSRILRTNRITPRRKMYWNLTHGKPVDVQNVDGKLMNTQEYDTWDEYNYLKTFKLFSVEGMDDPILYGMEEPFCNRVSFPLSDSAFYGISDHSLKRFISAEECGGSGRGDRVCFWLNRETKEILPGTTGAAGGFMGFSSWRTIYGVKGDSFIMREKLSWIGQARSNYNDEELLENAELFFDGDDMPFTRETILEAEAVDEYEINGERVTQEEYRACSEKYIEVGILE